MGFSIKKTPAIWKSGTGNSEAVRQGAIRSGITAQRSTDAICCLQSSTRSHPSKQALNHQEADNANPRSHSGGTDRRTALCLVPLQGHAGCVTVDRFIDAMVDEIPKTAGYRACLVSHPLEPKLKAIFIDQDGAGYLQVVWFDMNGCWFRASLLARNRGAEHYLDKSTQFHAYTPEK